MGILELNIKKLSLLTIIFLSINISAEYISEEKMKCEVIYENIPKIGNRKMMGKAAKQYYEKFKTSAQLEIMSSEVDKVPLIAMLDISGNKTVNRFFSQGCEINDSEFLCEYYKTNGTREMSTSLRLDVNTKLFSVIQKSSSSSSRISLESKVDGICK